MPAPLQAIWFDGVSARPQACELDWLESNLVLTIKNEEPRRYAGAQLRWPEQTRHGRRQMNLPDGGVVSVDDARAWDAWAQALGVRQPLAVRWALSWRGVALALLLLMATLFTAWRWGIPWGAEQAAQWVPERIQTQLGELVLADMRKRGWLNPSQLKPEQQERIAAEVVRMVRKAYPEGTTPAFRLQFFQAPKWLGPNAFALPGGGVIVTDELVTLLNRDDTKVSPALLGVLAHELGHVRERHGLRLVFEVGAVSVLMAWWVGDFSALLAGAPALAAQAHYARGHERAADVEAMRVMQAADIDPRAMVEFFDAVKKAVPQRDGEATYFGLATHPIDSERIRFFKGETR